MTNETNEIKNEQESTQITPNSVDQTTGFKIGDMNGNSQILEEARARAQERAAEAKTNSDQNATKSTKSAGQENEKSSKPEPTPQEITFEKLRELISSASPDDLQKAGINLDMIHPDTIIPIIYQEGDQKISGEIYIDHPGRPASIWLADQRVFNLTTDHLNNITYAGPTSTETKSEKVEPEAAQVKAAKEEPHSPETAKSKPLNLQEKEGIEESQIKEKILAKIDQINALLKQMGRGYEYHIVYFEKKSSVGLTEGGKRVFCRAYFDRYGRPHYITRSFQEYIATVAPDQNRPGNFVLNPVKSYLKRNVTHKSFQQILEHLEKIHSFLSERFETERKAKIPGQPAEAGPPVIKEISLKDQKEQEGVILRAERERKFEIEQKISNFYDELRVLISQQEKGEQVSNAITAKIEEIIKSIQELDKETGKKNGLWMPKNIADIVRKTHAGYLLSLKAALEKGFIIYHSENGSISLMDESEIQAKIGQEDQTVQILATEKQTSPEKKPSEQIKQQIAPFFQITSSEFRQKIEKFRQLTEERIKIFQQKLAQALRSFDEEVARAVREEAHQEEENLRKKLAQLEAKIESAISSLAQELGNQVLITEKESVRKREDLLSRMKAKIRDLFSRTCRPSSKGPAIMGVILASTLPLPNTEPVQLKTSSPQKMVSKFHTPAPTLPLKTKTGEVIRYSEQSVAPKSRINPLHQETPQLETQKPHTDAPQLRAARRILATQPEGPLSQSRSAKTVEAKVVLPSRHQSEWQILGSLKEPAAKVLARILNAQPDPEAANQVRKQMANISAVLPNILKIEVSRQGDIRITGIDDAGTIKKFQFHSSLNFNQVDTQPPYGYNKIEK